MKDILDSLLDESSKKIIETYPINFNKYFNIVELDNPESFWFSHTYIDDNIKNVAIKSHLSLKDPSRQINHMFYQLFLNHHDIVHFISEIVREYEGYTCCADKAKTIVDITLVNNMYLNYKPFKTIPHYSFSTPIIKGTKDWEDLILNYMNIKNPKNIERFNLSHIKIKHMYYLSKKRKMFFYQELIKELEKNEEITKLSQYQHFDEIKNIDIINIDSNILTQKIILAKNLIYAIKNNHPVLIKDSLYNMRKKIIYS